EVKIAGQKVYEAKVPLNQDGLALHPYGDLKEGEYTAVVTLPDRSQADCTFSVAEFTLSPLVATLEKHEYAQQRLSFALNLRLLAVPYSGPAEFGLQCKVCGERVVATQTVQAKDGLAEGEFDLSGHGGPFHVQVTTPDGNTALVAFPGTGREEREHVRANTLGQTADIGLLPWEGAQPVRGFYLGQGEMNLTPLLLESAYASAGRLQAATDLALAQVVLFDPRQGTSQVIEQANLKRGQALEFEVTAPYTLFTAAAIPAGEDKAPDGEVPFEGWGVVVKPLAHEARLSAPASARPGQEIDVALEIPPAGPEAAPVPAFCWLLVYDVRLEHESPVPKLARRIVDSVREASSGLSAGPAANVEDRQQSLEGMRFRTGALAQESFAAMPMQAMAAPSSPEPGPSPVSPAAMKPMGGSLKRKGVPDLAVDTEAPVMVMAPTRMEFPELAYQELFHFAGRAARTVRLGEQIGTWRVRAYVCRGADVQELTADVQADKPLYAELDLPAIASEGDEISAAVNYFSREPAELIIATATGESRYQVQGSGSQRFTIHGPGKIEVYLNGPAESDWSARHVARPGVQKVTASRLVLLDKGQSVAGGRVVVYPSVGQVLQETITALVDYPFG
ncbi:MAG: hypothetical protein L0322_22335, partial [Chloroflexi bacterium]|nr:hypothetical protein [Chloroflexota bacterium]